jgi:hypothetical protein
MCFKRHSSSLRAAKKISAWSNDTQCLSLHKTQRKVSDSPAVALAHVTQCHEKLFELLCLQLGSVKKECWSDTAGEAPSMWPLSSRSMYQGSFLLFQVKRIITSNAFCEERQHSKKLEFYVVMV